MFDHRQRRKQPPALGHDRDLAIGDVVRSQAYQALIAPSDRSRPDLRRRQTHDRADEGGLAHTVTAEQRDDFAGADIQRDAANDNRLTIAAKQVANLKHDAASRGRLPEPWRCGECLPVAPPPECPSNMQVTKSTIPSARSMSCSIS